MKKSSCFLLLFAAIVSMATTFSVDARPKRPKKDIHITVIKHPRPHIHRSLYQSIEVAVDAESNFVDVAFNENLGSVTIYVLNPMEQTITKYECNTDMEPLAFIPCNMEEDGVYTIKIFGKDLEAFGYFDMLE